MDGDILKSFVLGVGFDNLTMDDAVNEALNIINSQNPGYIVTPNPEIVWLCRENPRLREAIAGASLVLPDGIGVIMGARILGCPLKEKISGADFIELLIAKLAAEHRSVFLFGAKPGVAELAAQNLTAKYPGIVICGTADGYFQDSQPIIQQINAAAPDLLLVCLGAPKQELWLLDNRESLNVKLMAGLGGTLDVMAGTVKRAPKVWQKLNLEWLYRLIKEPKRFKRTLKLPLFIFAVLGERLRGKRNG